MELTERRSIALKHSQHTVELILNKLFPTEQQHRASSYFDDNSWLSLHLPKNIAMYCDCYYLKLVEDHYGTPKKALHEEQGMNTALENIEHLAETQYGEIQETINTVLSNQLHTLWREIAQTQSIA